MVRDTADPGKFLYELCIHMVLSCLLVSVLYNCRCFPTHFLILKKHGLSVVKMTKTEMFCHVQTLRMTKHSPFSILSQNEQTENWK